jgi:drug/metabolite transporter (DMT)-like permease
MLQVIGLTVLFSIATVISILLLGSRSIIAGDMNFIRILQILLSWQFLLGAVFAFAARMIFMVLNSVIYKIPELSASSTTITTLITTVSLLFVIVANYFFLGEKISTIQIIGAVVIFIGIFLITAK